MRIFNFILAVILSMGILGVFGMTVSSVTTPVSAEETKETASDKQQDPDKKQAEKGSSAEGDKDSNLLEFLL